MVMHGPEFTAFGEEPAHTFTSERNAAIAAWVRGLPNAELFAPNEGKLIDALVEKARLDLPVIEFDKRTREVVPPDTLPRYPTPYPEALPGFVRYVLPVKGDVTLLKLQPSPVQMLGYGVMLKGQILDGAIALYIADSGNQREVVPEANAVLDNLRVNSERLYQELATYNAGLVATVTNAVTAEQTRRQQEAKRPNDLLDQLP
jgi:hypothetical protein